VFDLPAQALDTRKIELSLPAGGKTYQVTAEPLERLATCLRRPAVA
jgi:hypothetical protein